MTELLKKWAELEPERCGLREGGGDTFPDNGFPTVYWLERRAPRSTGHVRFHGDGRMQIGGDEELFFAVIEAIEAREWAWSLHSYGGTVEAEVTVGSHGGEKFWIGGNGEHAYGLLLAYLAALEAEADQ